MDKVRDTLLLLEKRLKREQIPVPGAPASLPEAKAHKAIFIDGSNGEILPLSAGSLSLIRTIGLCYTPKGKLAQKKKSEFYSIAHQNAQTDLTTVPRMALPTSLPQAELSATLSIYRRLAELALAQELAQTTTETCIVLDGSLDAKTPQEKNALLELTNTCLQQKNSLIGFSKTSSLTHNGEYISSILAQKTGVWQLTWQETRFVKLHAKARHVFRVDIRGDEKTALEGLQFYASDPSFFGYPYPLIMADKYAKITQKEITEQQALFASKSSKIWSALKKESSAMDAHAVIDTINKNR